MKNIIIHNQTNNKTNGNRSYNTFFDDLTEKLKKRYYVKENRFFERAHVDRMKVYLNKRTIDYLELYECEYIIEDEDNGDFWILSFAEQISGAILGEQSNPHLKKVLYSQYIPDQMVHHCRENTHKYEPWIFFPMRDMDYDLLYENRLKNKNLLPKMYFKGGEDYRPIINHLPDNILSERGGGVVPPNIYFENMCKYKVALSIGGTANGDLCYRDVECMALGIPMIRFDFVTTLNPALIPNYHYISIPLQLDLPKHNDVLKDRMGNENHAKLIEEKFNEVINNKNLLNFVSLNSRKYYEKYLSTDSRIRHTLELLDLP